MSPALLEVWRISEAGTPPVKLKANEIVEDVEALCRGVVRNVTLAHSLGYDDQEQMLAELFERVVVLSHSYDPSRAGILFRPWLYRELGFDAIDYWRRWEGRRGQKRVVDSRLAEAALRDAGLDDYGDGRMARHHGLVAAGTSDSPEDRASDLGRLYARGDRETLWEERRLGLDEGARAQAGDPRPGPRALGRDAARDGGGAQGPHWLDCAECGWRTYPVPPNGTPGWRFPEGCLACGADLPREAVRRVA